VLFLFYLLQKREIQSFCGLSRYGVNLPFADNPTVLKAGLSAEARFFERRQTTSHGIVRAVEDVPCETSISTEFHRYEPTYGQVRHLPDKEFRSHSS